MRSFASLALFVAAVSAVPVIKRADIPSAAQIAALAPDLGVTAPLPPTGFGDCIGPNKNAEGKPINVPCSCPPSRDAFIKALTRDVQAGKAVNNPSVKISFPTGNTIADAHGRINAAAVTLQNLDGPGKGCPFAATTLGAQSKALDALAASGVKTVSAGAATPAAPASPAKATTAKASATAKAASAKPATSTAQASSSSSTKGGVPSAAQIAQLAPDLGVTAPLPPTGFGDCIGPNVGANGKPINVPCSCPPSRDAFIKALTRDVQAGKAVNNPSVKISFPTGDSVQDKLGRINAAAVTLQNLDGPGKGCPFAATTLGKQAKALQGK
jgi:hypothetical protein